LCALAFESSDFFGRDELARFSDFRDATQVIEDFQIRSRLALKRNRMRDDSECAQTSDYLRSRRATAQTDPMRFRAEGFQYHRYVRGLSPREALGSAGAMNFPWHQRSKCDALVNCRVRAHAQKHLPAVLRRPPFNDPNSLVPRIGRC